MLKDDTPVHHWLRGTLLYLSQGLSRAPAHSSCFAAARRQGTAAASLAMAPPRLAWCVQRSASAFLIHQSSAFDPLSHALLLPAPSI